MGIERRINVINNLFPDGHWFYISTKENPADHASRPSTPQEILSSNWLEGPSFLWSPSFDPETYSIPAPLPTILPEEELEVSILSTKVVKPSPFSHLFPKRTEFRKKMREGRRFDYLSRQNTHFELLFWQDGWKGSWNRRSFRIKTGAPKKRRTFQPVAREYLLRSTRSRGMISG